MWQKVKSFLKFVSLLRVEVFMFLTAHSLYIRYTPLDLLIQDKICRNTYNLSEEFCFNLPKITTNDTNYEYKTKILAEAVQYNMYQNIITYAPGIPWALFLGAWIDKYNHGRKAIFLIGSSTQCLEAIINWFNAYYFDSDVKWVLLSFVPYTLSGSMTWSTAYSYVAATTPEHLRAVRITILETIIALANLCGTLLAGKLINMSPLFGNGQLHNNAIIFLISGLSAFLAFVWTVFLINQQNDKKVFEKCFLNNIETNDEVEEEIKENAQKVRNNRQIIRLLFDINNIKEVFETAFKKRPNNARIQIWLIIGGIFCYLFVLMSVPSFLFQFVEKVYHWDAQIFSYMGSIGLIANCIVILTVTPLLIRIFKLKDMILSSIGFSGLMLQMIVLATLLSPTGYYVSLAMSCTTWMADIGLKSHLSKIVADSELGKIFTLLTVVDGIVPPIASSITTNVFKRTIDTFPGISFIILAIVCFIAVLICFLISYCNRIKPKPNVCPESQSQIAVSI